MEQRHRENAHAQEMFAKIERFLASALSQTEFCRQEGLVYWTFRYWLKKYHLKEALLRPPAEIPAGFIPLRVVTTETVSPSSTCVIEYPSGLIIRFNGPVDAT